MRLRNEIEKFYHLRYGKESFHERDYSYNHSRDQNNELEYSKEYELKSKYYNDKDDNLTELYGSNNFDRESNYNLKTWVGVAYFDAQAIWWK